MPGKGALARKRAAIVDVNKWVSYAISSGSFANPFPDTDKRHALFGSKLAHARQIESRFDDVCCAYGADPTELNQRIVPRPPLLTLDQLADPSALPFPND
jgi:hypothetical protein